MSGIQRGAGIFVTGLTMLAVALSLTDPDARGPASWRWMLSGVAVILLVGGALETVCAAVEQHRSRL
jgi:hypothetical protein